MPGLLPSGAAGLAGGAGQRVALGLAVQFGQVGSSQSLRHGVHCLVSSGAELTLVPRMPLRLGGADRAIAQDLGLWGFRFPRFGA
jgi:hypothetical protein